MNSPIRLLKPAVLLGTVVAAGLTFSCSTVSRQDSTRVARTVRVFDKNGRVESRTITVGQSSIVGRLAANKSSRSVPARVRPQPVPVRVEPTPVVVQRSTPAKPAPATLSVPVVVQTKPEKKTIVAPVNPPDMLSTGKVLSAHLVPSQPGFVRSPYTNPPRLVIVKDATPGTTMICPYTHKPFVVPAGFISAPPSKTEAYVSNSSTPPTRQISSSTINQPGSSPRIVVNNKEFGQVFPSPDARSNSPIKSEFANAPVNITPPAENKALQEAPYGHPIPGRPGFVNSPHAARNQLVDVTGLPAGMEVKCPYSGKLFRVPPSDMASGTPPSAPDQN